jgi:hypothetical protein
MTMQIKSCIGVESNSHSVSKSLHSSERAEILEAGLSIEIKSPGLRPIKQAELFNNVRRYIPVEYQDDMCPRPTLEIRENQRQKKTD